MKAMPPEGMGIVVHDVHRERDYDITPGNPAQRTAAIIASSSPRIRATTLS